MKFKLLDCDNDWVETDNNTWRDFDECKKDLEMSFLTGNMSISYLPFRFVDADSSRTKDKMDVYSIISEVHVDFKIRNLRVVPYSHRKAS